MILTSFFIFAIFWVLNLVTSFFSVTSLSAIIVDIVVLIVIWPYFMWVIGSLYSDLIY